jgi:hypothetical protein
MTLNKEQQLLERQLKMSKQEESYMEILIGFIFGALFCGLVITLVLNKLKFEEELAKYEELKKPTQETTELVFRAQWLYLGDQIHKDVEDNRINPEMFNKMTSFLRVLRNSPHQKPPSDYTITDSGAVVFNWNKVIYHRIEND